MKALVITLFLVLTVVVSSAQVAPNKFFIGFTDKNGTPYSISNPQAFLTQRSIDRRTAQSIPVVENDLPVNPSYIQQVSALGVSILNPTKWLNGVTVYAPDTSVMGAIRALPFVMNVYKCSGQYNVNPLPDEKFRMESEIAEGVAPVLPKSGNTTSSYNYGQSYTQIHQVKGDVMHDQGYHGEGKVIAVLDAGFENADFLPAFDSLRANNQILGTKDFVLAGNNVYREYYHGMAVLSIMGGNVPGQLVGTAPKASYWLLRSEDANTENIIEEYNWVSAAEFADSVGADVINSSLGYTVFDDPKYDHTCADMNGHSTPCTIGANFAASKGIAVINSAGNSGGTTWTCMGAPADGDNVMAIAAVDASGVRAQFSSVGVDTAGRVKPNVAAMGVQTIVARPDGTISGGNGTSYSSPVIAGLVACLWQSKPGMTNFDVYYAMERSCNNFNNPDSLLGYGIPDFSNAMIILGIPKATQMFSELYPNPFNDHLTLTFFSRQDETVKLTMIDQTGRVLLDRTVTAVQGQNTLTLGSLSGLSRGLYFLKVSGSGFTETKKIIK